MKKDSELILTSVSHSGRSLFFNPKPPVKNDVEEVHKLNLFVESPMVDNTPDESGWLAKQIRTSRQSIRERKKHSPHLFNEYHDMIQAEIEMNRAIAKYKEKKRIWDNLAED